MARGLFESIDWLIAKDKKICCLIDQINLELDTKITNQLGTPSFRSDTLANLPAPGQTGRMFIATDTFAFYRDNGAGWDLIGGPGIGTVTGSGTATQVAFWNGTSVISGSSNLYWDSANNILSIGTNTPSASAVLQADSITRGFLPPRMTQAQRTAIVSPAVGLIVYQTDATEGLYVNTSTGWRSITMV